MKLVTFEAQGCERVGVVEDDHVFDLSETSLPSTMIGLIAAWDGIVHDVQRFVSTTKPQHALADVHLKAPVPRPPKILAIGLNYADHIAETGREKHEHQVWFAKMTNRESGSATV